MRRLLTAMVRLFPGPFRRHFAEELREQIRADYDAARQCGSVATLLHACATAFDLLRSALAEHRNPAWAPRPPTAPRLPRRDREGFRTMMSGWMNDFRYALRTLRQSPGFALVTIGTLGLAIGANAGIFAVVDTVLLDPLPYADADHLVTIQGTAPGSDFPDEFGLAAEFYLQFRDEADLLTGLSPVSSFTATMRTSDRVERIRMSVPTASLFAILGVDPLLGRLPVPEDEDRVAVISHALWTDWFGADPDVVGRTYEMMGSSRTVIGVMEPEFWFPRDDVMVWAPVVVREEELIPGRFQMTLVARVAPGVGTDALVAQLHTLAQRIPDRFDISPRYAEFLPRLRPVVRPLREELVGVASQPLWILLGAVAIVLVIACANVANLFLVRAERRQRDLAVRRALGAGRGGLIRSQLAEALVVAALAGALAVVLAWVSVPSFVRAAPPDVPRLANAGITASTLMFTFAITAFAALVCGLLPAVRASSPRLTRLRESSRGATRRGHWGRDALVVAQTALALVLLIGSGLLVRSFSALRDVDPGYDVENLFTFQIAPEGEHLVDAAAYARFHLDFMERLRALPGVESVGLVENLPLDEALAGGRFLVEGAASEEDLGHLVQYTWAAGDYFRTMGIEMQRGRGFTDDEHLSASGSVVLGRSVAETLWPGQDPVGKRLKQRGQETWDTVVGVVEDVLQSDFRQEPELIVYYPLVGSPEGRAISSPAYVLETARADEIAPEARALVREIAPEAPMYRVYTLAGLASGSMVRLSFTMLTLGVASALALILGAVGLFGVLSYVVAERTREIGVRMALGAQGRQVRRMVVVQAARVVALGVTIGIVVAIGTTRVLATLLFGVNAADPGTFAAMSAAMVLVGMLAGYLPARRASAVDPIESLRDS